MERQTPQGDYEVARTKKEKELLERALVIRALEAINDPYLVPEEEQ